MGVDCRRRQSFAVVTTCCIISLVIVPPLPHRPSLKNSECDRTGTTSRRRRRNRTTLGPNGRGYATRVVAGRERSQVRRGVGSGPRPGSRRRLRAAVVRPCCARRGRPLAPRGARCSGRSSIILRLVPRAESRADDTRPGARGHDGRRRYLPQ